LLALRLRVLAHAKNDDSIPRPLRLRKICLLCVTLRRRERGSSKNTRVLHILIDIVTDRAQQQLVFVWTDVQSESPDLGSIASP